MSDKPLISTLHKPSTLDEQLDSIHQASPISAVARIQVIARNQDGYSPDQVLLIFETALTREVRTNPQRRDVIHALKQAIKKATTKKLPIEALADKIDAERAQTVEIVTASQVDAAELDGLASEITSKIDLIAGHEGAFEEATLEHRLEIGLHIAKAQEIFTLSHSEAGALKGKDSESLSTVDRLSPPPAISHGFITWLGKNVPALKRPTAYRYATAFRSLDLPLTAKPAEIRAKLKTLRHQAGKDNLPMPTLAALVKAAPKPPKPEVLTVLVPKSSKQLKLEDARETFGLWMETFDKALKQGHLDNLDRKGLEQLNEFAATVRDRIKARLK